MRETQCPRACGKCCDVIMLKFKKKEFLKKEDGRLLLNLWYRISKFKAKQLRSEIDITGKGNYYYICKAFDSITKICKIYKNRPRVCKFYPFYDDIVLNADKFFKDCYWINQLIKY